MPDVSPNNWMAFWCHAETMLPGLWMARPLASGLSVPSRADGDPVLPMTSTPGFDFVLTRTEPLVPNVITESGGGYTNVQPADPDPVVLANGTCRVTHGVMGGVSAAMEALRSTLDLDWII